MKCPHCKRNIEEDSQFCVYCGSKVLPYCTGKENKSKIPVVIAGIVGACIIIIGVCFGVLFINEKQPVTVRESVTNESDVQEKHQENKSKTTDNMIKKEANEESGDVNDDKMHPFYGIWITASKAEGEMTRRVEELQAEGMDAQVCVTTDWENLNREKYYVITIGRYDTKEEAETKLKNVKEQGYEDAYVKYTGKNISE